MRIRKGVMQNHLQFSVISMVYLALMALFVLHQSADGYQLRRRPSFLAPRRNLKPKTTSVTSSKQNHLKRNYRNEIHPQEDEEVRLDDTISSSLPSPTTTTSSHQHMQKKRKRRILQSPLIVGRKPKATVRTVDELRHAILDQGLRLSDVAIVNDQSDEEPLEGPASIPTDFFHNHAVRELIKERYQQQSTPGRRLANDTSILALSIEGGGMRGCVSAGMVAAIASLGLTDTIDRVYGSSAGSVVGAYLVSRQVCMDVYVDILPAAQKLFVCKKRMIKSLASSLVDVLVSSLRKENVNNKKASKEDAISPAQLNPGMNISFVLDGIMGKDHGIRPLDIETFRQNDAKQPLRVVSSTIDPETGRLYSKCWGSRDFFNVTAVEKADGTRKGLFACLEASMTVPVSGSKEMYPISINVPLHLS
jgi:Patatin-like phospholipase